jgi:hypothetical protein
LARRKSNSPWGSAYKEGLPSTAVNDRIEVDEILYPSVNTGTIDVATGQWEGVTLSDKIFLIDATHEATPNGGAVLSPQATPQYIDMTEFNDLFIAIRPSNGGAYAIEAVMGPATNTFTNLSPVNAGAILRGNISTASNHAAIENVIVDSADTLTADVWNIFIIGSRLKQQKVLQFKITNNSGGESDITFAYMRMV